ncbi:MAG: nucleotidyltransferase domain-containing protein [Calditrichaeota bacterium]|nr:MAG: nucleotidyltransferase domain-containing protein [Calditrichota bacterium]MBL1204031.1 nucleotidyltransferase domain-containing protein [Calditrichota bacterium]NOG43862.1 nucleotidyltransferase domain-containing protein [Calditrichota bacterium]
MISNEDKEKIRAISKKYNVKKVLLFGSSIEPYTKANDIDLAVEGVEPRNFYKYCGELLFGLSKPVDVVDLSKKSRFTDFITRKGVVLYG